MMRALCSNLLMLSLLLPSLAFSQQDAKKDKDELKLEDIFPEKSLFGPSARDAAFSADGRYAAYLYRPYDERRHGNDLWIYDFQTKKLNRITSVSTMAEFQKSTRKVKEDRLKKAKEAAEKEKKKGEEEGEGKTSDEQKSDKDAKKDGKKDAKKEGKKEKTKEELEQEREWINTVGEKDADDEKAPRYSGISGFSWHPEKNEMLIVSEGDIYHLADVAKPELNRLTRTQSGERNVRFLPSGDGYTYQDDDVVYRVKFGDHLVEQINPRLGNDQNLRDYTISPDSKRIVMVASTGRRMEGGREVDYIRYRDRFAKSATTPRTVADDEMKPQDVYVYLYDLDSAMTEESNLIQIFHTQIDEPRDVISDPNWSLDSAHVTFCFFDQENSEVHVRVGEFPEAGDDDDQPSLIIRPEDEKKSDKPDDETGVIDHPARIVYRFKHDGGPNTPRQVSPQFAWDSRHIALISEQTGFRHVHLLDTLYESVKVLTSGNYEVYPLKMSEDRKRLFVTATKDSPAREMVYSVNLETGEMERLSKEEGTYSNVAVSDDGKRLIANFVTYGKLTELLAQDNGKMEVLTDSHPEKARELTERKPEFFTYENRHGHEISGMMFKPEGWKKSKKVPLLIYVYGGPLGTRKSVTDGSYSSDGYFFQNYMAQKHGYLTVVIDPRGQSGYGGLFEKSNYEQVGRPQVEDLVDGVMYLADEFGIDREKVGIYGWSFGGFQTQMCMYTAPDVFTVGIAGAGPTEWENYNSWYTTGTVGRSEPGKAEQKKYSLRPLAKNLKGKLLLLHGMEDTNVLFQDTVAIYRELLQAGKETLVEIFLDPTGGHGLGGDVKRLNRFRKYEEFLLRTLGSPTQKS